MLRKLMPVVALTLAAAACGSDGGGKDDVTDVTQKPDSGALAIGACERRRMARIGLDSATTPCPGGPVAEEPPSAR